MALIIVLRRIVVKGERCIMWCCISPATRYCNKIGYSIMKSQVYIRSLALNASIRFFLAVQKWYKNFPLKNFQY